MEEYEKLVSSMKKEQQLRQQIRELRQYRKNGITKLEGQLMDLLCPFFLNFIKSRPPYQVEKKEKKR